ncbi:MAG: DUF5810 domain-containing protein [Halolamina sp.]|uniref:DUF5810 domain-containing protein n=1 Tax=Halolamina sp. TaxID=1940283 RepID=UPI002FC2A816
MGYSCPVCETPQHDSEHLANHLAMTAMLHEDDHEAWLDDHVDGWAELTPPALGKRVVDAAEEVDYDEAAVEQADIPEEFRGDQADASHEGGHQHDRGGVPEVGGVDESAIQGADSLDEETEEVLAEARELTKERREQAAEGAEEGETDDEIGEAGGTDPDAEE